MARVASTICWTHIHDFGVRIIDLDLQACDERVFCLNDGVIRFRFQFEPDSKPHDEAPRPRCNDPTFCFRAGLDCNRCSSTQAAGTPQYLLFKIQLMSVEK